MKSIRLCVFGSRRLKDYRFLKQKLDHLLSNLDLNEIEWISGTCEQTDKFGERYANEHNIPIKPFPANWNSIDKPDAVIKSRKDGTRYNAKAGLDRNEQMAQYVAEFNPLGYAIGFLPDYCESKGTQDMTERCKAHGIKLKIVKFNERHGG